MNGFGPAVDGYYDTDDQLARYFLTRAEAEFEGERERKAESSSQAAYERYREKLRQTIRSRLGGLPDRMDDPEIRRTEISSTDAYDLEAIAFESRPNFHVTANCYVPVGEGPHPAILFLCGHVQEAKADPLNQKACQQLAANGFVVLICDPIGQGDRRQYADIDRQIGDVGGGVSEHCFAGQKCFHTGGTLMRYMLHDARCGFEYLRERDAVDPERIGVTGTSGGGTQAKFLALFEERLACVAPCCSVTDRQEWLKTGKRIDAEQVIPGAIPAGINHDDFLAAMAPRPVCVGAARWDQYFPIEGVETAIKRIKSAYAHYDAEDNVNSIFVDNNHCSVYEFGAPIFEWFCDIIGDHEYISREETVRDASTLSFGGQVLETFTDERTIEDLIRAHSERNFGSDRSPVSVDSTKDARGQRRANCNQSLRERIENRLEFACPCRIRPRYIPHDQAYETQTGDVTITRVWFRTERNPDIVVTGLLVSHKTTTTNAPAVVLYENGSDEATGRKQEIVDLAEQYGSLFIFDPRGIGAVQPRPIPIPAWMDEYDGIYGTEFKLACDALLLGTSLFDLRVFDITRAVEFLRAETEADSVSFVGEGNGAYHALFSAAVTDNVAEVRLREMGPSFRERLDQRDRPFDSALITYDVVGSCDTPRIRSELETRGVQIW